jgi:hypothetical protein
VLPRKRRRPSPIAFLTYYEGWKPLICRTIIEEVSGELRVVRWAFAMPWSAGHLEAIPSHERGAPRHYNRRRS